MKVFRNLFLLALCALCSVGVAEAKMLSFGVSAGMNNEKLKIRGLDADLGRSTGYEVSAVADLKLIPLLCVTPQLRYSSNNFTYDGGEINSKAIDVPIVVGFSLFGPIKIEAGPRFSIYDKAKATVVDANGVSTESEIGRIHPEMGYVIGAKLSLLGKVFVAARYYGNFDDYMADFNDASAGLYTKSSSFSLSAGFMF